MKALITALIIFCSLLCEANEKENSIWSKQGNAVAFCLYENESKCYVIADKNIINVSQVENANIGKLGILRKSAYEKVLTTPVEWLDSGNENLIVSFKTEAWLSGKKYTVTEPVLIKNGEYQQR